VPISSTRRAPAMRTSRYSSLPDTGATSISGIPASRCARSAASKAGSGPTRVSARKSSAARQASGVEAVMRSANPPEPAWSRAQRVTFPRTLRAGLDEGALAAELSGDDEDDDHRGAGNPARSAEGEHQRRIERGAG